MFDPSLREVTVTSSGIRFEMETLKIGPDKLLMAVNKKILCEKNPGCAKMFPGRWKESLRNIATFPEDNVRAFENLVACIYLSLQTTMASHPLQSNFTSWLKEFVFRTPQSNSGCYSQVHERRKLAFHLTRRHSYL